MAATESLPRTVAAGDGGWPGRPADTMSTGTLDIEDVGSSVDSLPTERHARRLVLPKRPQKKDAAAAEERAVGDSHIPGNATIYLRTWGCSHNSSDGEYMAGLLSAYGYRITGAPARISAAPSRTQPRPPPTPCFECIPLVHRTPSSPPRSTAALTSVVLP